MRRLPRGARSALSPGRPHSATTMKDFRSRRPSEAEAIEATAAAWMAQHDDGLTPAQSAEFAAWRAADPRHDAAVRRLDTAWTTMQQLREYRPEAARHPDRDVLEPIGTRPQRAPFRAWVTTVSLAASLALAAVWWFTGSALTGGRSANTFATTPEGYERVSLADGSMVELNAGSEIKVEYSSGERRVRLTRGEAHFTVTRNPARPFIVEASGLAVRAVGTAFNVRLGSADVEVLVTHGKVEVASAAREPAGEAAGRSEDGSRVNLPTTTLLGASERVLIPAVRNVARVAAMEVAPKVEKIGAAEIREALAWQGPRLVFVDTPLAEVIAQFNRRNEVQIELAGPELGALPIGGSFRMENVDAFVRLLASSGDIAFERVSDHRVVLRSVR